ncbi:UPF0389 protein CG9231 isoform X1 [Temnothorax americanus]|uniref:UPF0389 protein CG9231 isoform X1 n=2 Tax=Temnothorax americanus TaxID=1964332 RepID=UPI0040685144
MQMQLMLSRQFARNVQLRVTTRCFTRSNVIRETNKDKIPAQKSSETDGVIGSRMHRVSDFDKRMLVWVKRYPSVADVPKDVTEDCILTARNKARIKTCNYMIAFTLIGCLISVILGKRDAAKGENLLKQREDWLRDRLAEDKNK